MENGFSLEASLKHGRGVTRITYCHGSFFTCVYSLSSQPLSEEISGGYGRIMLCSEIGLWNSGTTPFRPFAMNLKSYEGDILRIRITC